MNSEVQSYLEHYSEPLDPYLARPDVTDIYINQPGEIWIESLGGEIERIDDPRLDEPLLWRFSRQVASQSHQGVSRRQPLLSARLPDGSRIQIVAPPATRWGLAIAIRRHVATSFSINSYASARSLSQRPGGAIPALSDFHAEGDFPALLAAAVKRRLNIVISGGTSSGKTTLLNSLLAEVPSEERLIFIEDTPELRRTHPNSVGLIAVRGDEGEAQVTPNDLLQATLRMRPDRIVLGELRGAEAFTFLRAINTGHPGSLTTVHADSPERALVQVSMMGLQAGLGISYGDIHRLVSTMVDVVVQVERRGAKRVIGDIWLRRDEPAP